MDLPFAQHTQAEQTEQELHQQAKKEHQTIIEQSWYRCETYGLSHGALPDYGDLRDGDVSTLLDQHRKLIKTTENEVLPYYENILANSSCLIVLADNSGQVLNTWGTSRFRSRGVHGLVPGHVWQESGVGTNAIGTAIATGQAVQVSRDEHFLRANRYMVGSASPIFDTKKQMIGVLDISSDAYLPQDHTLGMVKLMSLSVENQLIHAAFHKEHFIITFSNNVSGLDSHWAGLLVLDETGRVVSANRRAWAMLTTELALVSIEDIFDCKFLELRQQPINHPLTLRAFGRYRMYVRVQQPTAPPLKIPDFREPQADQVQLQRAIPKNVVPLSKLEHGDSQVKKLVAQASRVMEKDIPILIRGETGAGKEILVRSLHYHSSRANKTLVAINCASIPNELVESELFGYEKGAFTGASQKGSPGLIRMANGGTLFLDEIGEMPIHVQARLLRVLQEREVAPLGSTQAYAVDLRVVAATNRDLKQQVADGRFRQDLFYRIAGLSIELPPLRARQDKLALIHYVYQRLAAESEGAPLLSDDVAHLLTQHSWPGNLRQLVNVLKIAQVMSSGDRLQPNDLPDEFYEGLKSEQEALEVPLAQPESMNALASSNIGQIQTAVAPHRQTLVLNCYEQTQGNISQTAKLAGVSRNTVYKYLRNAGITG